MGVGGGRETIEVQVWRVDRVRVSSPSKLDISRDSLRRGMEVELGEVVENGWEEGRAGWAIMPTTTQPRKRNGRRKKGLWKCKTLLIDLYEGRSLLWSPSRDDHVGRATIGRRSPDARLGLTWCKHYRQITTYIFTV